MLTCKFNMRVLNNAFCSWKISNYDLGYPTLTYNFSTTAKTTARVASDSPSGRFEIPDMSTFGGKIQEIPYISVDRFDGENKNSEVYFLSHCHSDHMCGLGSESFWEDLVINDKFIYASQISCIILRKKYNAVNIRELSVYASTTINLGDQSLTIITVPAGHCPGSVMFLFETESGKVILYTGDFRMSKNDVRKVKQFYNSFKEVRTVDKIYLDTTFFSKSYNYFPKREKSLKEICNFIENHINKGKHHIVHILTGAYIGYECVFREIYSNFKIPVHVNESDYHVYRLIPELDAAVTLNASETQIHCNCRGYREICVFPPDNVIHKIKITAFTWKSETLEGGISQYDASRETLNVCYSTHASLEECTELIKFLKPKEIEVCVENKNPELNENMKQLIEDLLTEIHVKTCLLTPQFFETNFKVKKKKFSPDAKKNNKDPNDILKSPPREKRQFPRRCFSSEDIKSPPRKNILKNLSMDGNSKIISEVESISKLSKKSLSQLSYKLDENIEHMKYYNPNQIEMPYPSRNYPEKTVKLKRLHSEIHQSLSTNVSKSCSETNIHTSFTARDITSEDLVVPNKDLDIRNELSTLFEKREKLGDTCSHISEDNSQSSQISLDELQISSEYKEENVLLNIINGNIDQTEELDEISSKEIQKQCFKWNNSENVILEVIAPEESADVKNTTENDFINKHNESQDVLLDIINFKSKLS